MKRLVLVLWVLSALFIYTDVAQAKSKEKEKAAIEALVDAYIRTINEGDLELVGKIWSHDDCVTFTRSSGNFKGYEQIRDSVVLSFKNNFIKRDLKREELVIVVDGKSAWAEFVWKFDAVRNDGSKHTGQGRETQIFRKERGEWKLVHIHY